MFSVLFPQLVPVFVYMWVILNAFSNTAQPGRIRSGIARGRADKCLATIYDHDKFDRAHGTYYAKQDAQERMLACVVLVLCMLGSSSLRATALLSAPCRYDCEEPRATQKGEWGMRIPLRIHPLRIHPLRFRLRCTGQARQPCRP